MRFSICPNATSIKVFHALELSSTLTFTVSLAQPLARSTAGRVGDQIECPFRWARYRVYRDHSQ